VIKSWISVQQVFLHNYEICAVGARIDNQFFKLMTLEYHNGVGVVRVWFSLKRAESLLAEECSRLRA
jgi:hypothetical protein